MAVVWRLIALVAVMLMPLGMAPATAAQSGTQSAATMPMEDCPGEGSMHHGQSTTGDCAMPCASALAPTTLSGEVAPLSFASDHGRPGNSDRLHGLVIEIATPPPRIA